MNTVLYALGLLPLAIMLSVLGYFYVLRRQGKPIDTLKVLYHCSAACTGVFLLVVMRSFFNGDFAQIDREKDPNCNRFTQACPTQK